MPKVEQEIKCQKCQDKGFILGADSKQKKCTCRIEQEVKTYITSALEKFKTDKNFDYNKFNQNLLFDKTPNKVFGSILKSFLIQKYFKDKTEWYSLTGSDIVENYVEADHYWIYEVPFLVVKLGRDYNNKAMGSVIRTILNSRLENPSKTTWIYVYEGAIDTECADMYGSDMWNLILDKENFKNIKVKQ